MSGLRIVRVMHEVGDLAEAARGYATLLDTPGEPVGGGRHYFRLDGPILGIVEVAGGGRAPRPAGQDLYLEAGELQPVHERAARLGWLSRGDVHGKPGGEIVVRPWGERSFYVEDPWGNGLCFVETGSLFTGKR